MTNLDLKRLIFFDIETASLSPNYETFSKEHPTLSVTFSKYLDWFVKRFPEDQGKPIDYIYENRACLQPEFGKVICVSFGIFNDKKEIKLKSFYNDNEKDLLMSVNDMLNDVGVKGYKLCGHNISNFDIPFLALRMIINGIKPSPILPKNDTKPWERNLIDTKDFWSYGRFGAISSLDLMCNTLGIESPKTDEISGNKIHNIYWNDKNIQDIAAYCEFDVRSTMMIVDKLNSIFNN